MRIVFSMLLFASAAAALCAQVPTTPQTKDKPKNDKSAKLPPSPLDKVEGYKRRIIEGFTVMLSAEAVEAELPDAEVKPLDALALEFQTLKKTLPVKIFEALQKLPVWVDWDEYEPLGNGRDGKAVATYSWEYLYPQLATKKIAYKSRCVTVHSLKMLAESHQPKIENQSLALLREYAHAVHEQLLGMEHAGIKAGYRTIMERRLYDRAQVVCARESDFFGELTCAYFDQLHHYPKTRDELKKHDPASLFLLESIWGNAKKTTKPPLVPAATVKQKTLTEPSAADGIELAFADVTIGATVHGPDFKTGDGQGCAVILATFGGDELVILEKLAKLYEELSPYGAKVVVAHSPTADAEAIKKKLDERGIAYTGLDKVLFPQYEGDPRPEPPGHAVVFDAEGKSVFRGSGYDATPHARAAVAKMLIAKAISGDAPKPLMPLLDGFAQGSQPILEFLPKIAAAAQSGDPAVAGAAKALATAILAPGVAQLAEAQALAKSDPLAAYSGAEKLSLVYKGTSVAAKAAGFMEPLKSNPVVAKELKARKLFDPIKKLDQFLMTQPGSNATLDDKFNRPNKATIDQLLALHSQLKKAHLTARCTEESIKLAAKYSLGE